MFGLNIYEIKNNILIIIIFFYLFILFLKYLLCLDLKLFAGLCSLSLNKDFRLVYQLPQFY